MQVVRDRPRSATVRGTNVLPSVRVRTWSVGSGVPDNTALRHVHAAQRENPETSVTHVALGTHYGLYSLCRALHL